MPTIYNAAVRTARMTVARDAIDGGPAAGVLQIGTAGMALVLAEITLGDPCGTVTDNVLTFSGLPREDTAANASGLAAAARIRDSNAVDVITGLTVGTSDTDIVLDVVNLVAGQRVVINSATITHAS